MELQLKNIGMIKEANVKIDGLTVIAGENDTGKSTVGKIIFCIIKARYAIDSSSIQDEKNFQEEILNNLLAWHYLLFKKDELPQKSYVSFKDQNSLMEIKRDTDIHEMAWKLNLSSKAESDIEALNEMHSKSKYNDVIMIETPVIWNMTDFFRDISQVESQMNIRLNYPALMKDLNFKLHIKSASITGVDIKDRMTSLMGGEFKKDESDHYFFDKNGTRVELINTATGIKSFAIFQVLSQNNWLNDNTVLVLDEPEVHLHPKWQLEMAKVIVDLVKNGVKIVVNSHSPYMIEALERYAEKAEVPADFYLAEDGIIDKVEDNNSKTLAKIFHKLSAPYETFNQMDSETLKGG